MNMAQTYIQDQQGIVSHAGKNIKERRGGVVKFSYIVMHM